MQFAKKKVEMPTENPWKKYGSKNIYDNPWIHVREDAVLNPAGGKGIYGVVSFKNKAIGILPIDEEGFTYLVGQYRYTLNEYSWEIPEGGGPMGEDPIQAAQRELKEETGFTASHWELLSRIHTSNSVTDEEGFLYIATGLTSGESEPEETEALTVKKVHMTAAVTMVMNGEITDSMSMASILMAARKLGF